MENIIIQEQEQLNLFLQPKSEVEVLPIENKSLLTADRSDLSVMASLVLQGVDDGFADPLDTLLIAKKGAYVFDGIIEGLKGKVSLPEGKNYSKHHCAVREQATGVKYYFDECNDPVWTNLNHQAQIIELRLKEREKWLKTFTKATEVEAEIDEETGEELAPARTVNPPVKVGGTSVVVTIKNSKEDGQ